MDMMGGGKVGQGLAVPGQHLPGVHAFLHSGFAEILGCLHLFHLLS